MKKGKHPVRKTASVAVRHENAYEEWRLVLLDDGILSKSGKVDLEVLEKKYPGELDQDQIIWIERMQKGEVFEEGEDVPVQGGGVSNPAIADAPVDPIESESESEPPAVVKEEPEPPKKKTVKSEEPAEEEEESEEPADDGELAPPPLPGEAKKEAKNDAKNDAEEAAYAVGDTLKIQIEEDGEPEEVTVAKIAKDGIHLASSKDEETEYLVDPEELKEMIV